MSIELVDNMDSNSFYAGLLCVLFVIWTEAPGAKVGGGGIPRG